MNKWTNGARRTMAVLGVAFGLLSVSAQADDRVLGAVIGGSAGAVIGHTVNGRNGALVGGALGAAAGAVIAASDRGDYRHGYYGVTSENGKNRTLRPRERT